METEIPIIDLKDFPSQLSKLIEACEEWGCFRIINHKIPEELLLEMKRVVRSLFDLPPEIKRRNTGAIASSGYVALSPQSPICEAFGLYDVNSSNAVEAFCTQLNATPCQRETIKSYSYELHELAMDIGRKIAEGMGLSCDLFKGWPCQFRINKYHFTEETVGSSGITMHTDSGFLTLLHEDDCIGGLEVMDKKGEFIAVDPVPGSLFVNIGDTAKAWSNGRFCNVKHLVRCKEAATRVSVALFLLGPKKDAVDAPPDFVSSNVPRLYLPFIYEDYREFRLFKGLHAGEALAFYTTQQAPTLV
ncbi:2-oxoglutarate-dependent dioxygenase DAO-like [Tasmannia lanceolata]|uniref:2-oxoglutarate-dependent dioxygenase DAO-like n=1 Tax=Tasmannia lanceolata TaxID=3420 RepID=UPI0040627BD2